jgi:hypothetical protein
MELYRQRKTQDSSTRTPWLSKQQSSSSESGRTGQENVCLTESLFHISKGYLTCCKILRHVASGFTSPLNEGVQQIFIALENLLPSAGF